MQKADIEALRCEPYAPPRSRPTGLRVVCQGTPASQRAPVCALVHCCRVFLTSPVWGLGIVSQAIVEEGVRIVETAGRNPAEYIKFFKSHGCIVIHKCVAIKVRSY